MERGFSIQEIMHLLPHAYPFLLVDRVVEWEPNTVIRAYKNVTFNEPFFQGHFPGAPIMPGVLIMEALAQCSGMLVLKTVSFPDDSLFLFTSMDNVRFRKPVTPGDRLDMECRILKSRLQLWKMDTKAFVSGVLVAEGTLTAAISSKKELQ